MCLSPMLHLQAIKLGYFCWMPHRLTESFWRFFTRHQTPNPIYLHFICCTVMQRIREAVAVKPTLKSLRDEISFQKGRFWRATLSRSGAYRRSEGDFFSLRVGVLSMRADVCIRVYMWTQGKRKKLQEPVTRSSGQFCASCVALFIELHTWL